MESSLFPTDHATKARDGSKVLSFSNLILRWESVVLLTWVGVALYLTLIPRPPFPPNISDDRASQLAHGAIHAGFAYLISLAVLGSPAKRRRWIAATVGATGSICFSLVVEALQELTPDRTAEVEDIVVGAMGAVLGAVTGWGLARTPLPTSLQRRLALIGVFISIPTLAIASAMWDPSLPRIGDHWHARYAIEICGEALPPLPGANGEIHTHGQGVIHIHPHRKETEGTNATLALAFSYSGATLGDRFLELPDGRRFENGDGCGDGTDGQLRLLVNGKMMDEPSRYVPTNHDRILIEFR